MTDAAADDRTRVRITIRGKVIADFLRTAPAEWEEVVEPSKAQKRFLERRDEELRNCSHDERRTRERGDGAHMRGTHLVRYVGKTQWGYWHPDWAFDQDPSMLPGYREMYDFGHGVRLESAKLCQYLEGVLMTGGRRVELDVLRAMATRRR